jgi:hypothetical protein
MNTSKAIFIGLGLIALSISISDVIKPAKAGLFEVGRYIGVSTNVREKLFVVDTATGEVRVCNANLSSSTCGPWSKTRVGD